MFNKTHLVDKTVLLILAGRVINSLGGFVTIYFVLHYLNDKLQGHYYTFLNLIGFSVFFEFGLSTLIIQLISHHVRDTYLQKQRLVGPESSLNQFLTLVKNILVHAFFLAIFMALSLGVLGGILLEKSATLYLPWLLLVLVYCLSFFINTAINIIEGTGKINDVAIARMLSTLVSIPTLWLCLSSHLGVYALVIQAIANVITLSAWLLSQYGLFIRQALNQHISIKDFFSYLKSVFPLQKRLSVSFLSIYMGAQVYVPLMFALGQVELAGKLGVTLQAFNAINGFAITWINSKLALFGASISKGERLKVYAQFKSLFGTSLLVLILLLLILWTLFFALNQTNSPYLSRFLSAKYILLFSITAIGIHVYTSINTYLLSFKLDPLFKLNLLRIIFLFTSICVIYVLKEVSYIFGIYLINNVLIGMLGAIYVLHQFHTKILGKNEQ